MSSYYLLPHVLQFIPFRWLCIPFLSGLRFLRQILGHIEEVSTALLSAFVVQTLPQVLLRMLSLLSVIHGGSPRLNSTGFLVVKCLFSWRPSCSTRNAPISIPSPRRICHPLLSLLWLIDSGFSSCSFLACFDSSLINALKFYSRKFWSFLQWIKSYICVFNCSGFTLDIKWAMDKCILFLGIDTYPLAFNACT